RLGLAHAVSTLRRAASSGCLPDGGYRRQHGGILALALAALRPGELLEGRAVARSRTWPHLCRGGAYRARVTTHRFADRQLTGVPPGGPALQQRFAPWHRVHAVPAGAAGGRHAMESSGGVRSG